MVVIHTLLKMIIQNRPLLLQAKSSFSCAPLISSEAPQHERSSLITEDGDQQVD